MSDTLAEMLKRFAENIPAENTKISSTGIEPKINELPGDPNCPICGGVGYIHRDYSINHPQFGRLEPCNCRQASLLELNRRRLYEYSNLPQLKTMTFESFNPRGRIGMPSYQMESLERAYNHAQQFAQNLDGWLLLQGNYGCGKTHLAAAIANFCAGLGIPSMFLTVPDLLDNLRGGFNDANNNFNQRFDSFRNVRLLILDDLGTQTASEWAREKIFQIFDHRYIQRLPTVITTNQQTEEIDGRIRSRLQDPSLVRRVTITAPDYRNPTQTAAIDPLSALGLVSEMTFGSFSDRRDERLPAEDRASLDRAFKAAREFAENPNGWLTLMGPYGSGKTHLAAAIANYRLGLGMPPVFVTVPDLLDYLRATFAPDAAQTFDRRFDEVRNARLLVLDDLGTQHMSSWVREKLYQLFNHRYSAKLPTVITTADSLEKIDQRLQARMSDTRLSKIYAITVPPYGGPRTPRRR